MDRQDVYKPHANKSSLPFFSMAGVDDSDVPESGAVFTFGKSKFAEDLPNKFWVRNEKVLQVACGDEHTALVAESGRMFMFGPNDWGQLGVGTQRIANRPTCIKSLKHEQSRLVACGRSHSIIATESGNIYTCGANGEGQLGVKGVGDSNVPVHVTSLQASHWRMLAAGCDHSLALTDCGKVYAWGSNSEGQLGLGRKGEVPVPTHLDMGHPVCWIACGYYHSALITENGQLWVCGENEGGKLGVSGRSLHVCNTPQRVTTIPHSVKAVSCGGSHTAALTEAGDVYMFGTGPNGQLGLGMSVTEAECPARLDLPFKVSQVCCGENFTALVSESGQLYTFGDGRHGKLGQGSEKAEDIFTPTLVDRFVHFHVDQVACGGCHMVVRATPRTVGGAPSRIIEESGESTSYSFSNRWPPPVNGNGFRSHNTEIKETGTASQKRRSFREKSMDQGRILSLEQDEYKLELKENTSEDNEVKTDDDGRHFEREKKKKNVYEKRDEGKKDKEDKEKQNMLAKKTKKNSRLCRIL